MDSQFWWYVTRASGIVAWLLLTASVIWGVILSTHAFPERRRPAAPRSAPLARWVDRLVRRDPPPRACRGQLYPLRSRRPRHSFRVHWQPGAVALGVIAARMLVAIEFTSLAIRRLPRYVWRGIHLSSYGLLADQHPCRTTAGTDRTHRLYQATAAASIIAVAWASLYRAANRRATTHRSPTHPDSPLRRSGAAPLARSATGAPEIANPFLLARLHVLAGDQRQQADRFGLTSSSSTPSRAANTV